MSVPSDRMEDQLNPFRIDEPSPTVPEPDRPYVLTLQDIKDNRNLWEAGALPGDQVSNDNTLIRNFSDAEDSRTTKYRLTETDILENPNLQEIGAEPGDLVDENNSLIKTGSDSAMRQFMYGFDESGNDVTNLGAWLEQYIPMGNLSLTDGYISADEIYGEGFVAASPEVRRDMQARARERSLLAEYGEDFQPDESSIARTVGGVTKALATPTTLLPVGQTIRGATAIGAGLGFTYSATEQLANTGEIDFEEALPSTIIGGVGAGALTAAFKGAGRLGQRMAEKSSSDLINNVQAKVYQKQSQQGLSREKALQESLEELNVSREEFARAATLSGNKVRLTANAQKAQDELDAMLQSDSAVSRLLVPSLDKYLGTLSTRIKNISEPVFGAVRKFEYKTHSRTAKALEDTAVFSRRMGELGDGVKNPLARALFNGNFKAARGILKTSAPDLLDQFDNVVVPLIRQIGGDLQQAGYKNIDLGVDYFPRLVKDLEGLRKSFGMESRGAIDDAVVAFAKAKGIETKNVPLEDVYKKIDKSDLDMVIEKVIRNEPITLASGKLLKPRKIDQLRADQLRFYASPEEALQMYIRRSIHDAEKRKLFGRGMEGEATTEASIQRFVADEVKSGNIKSDQQQEMVNLLRARFVGGEEPLGSIANFFRDTGYAGTIANPMTALIQLGDLAQSATFNGLRNTVSAMFGAKNMRVVDLGVQQASIDLVSPRKTANILNTLFRLSGFSRLDQLAKETTINASLNKFTKGLTSKNPKVKEKTIAELRKKYAGAYGDEFDSLVDDLTNGVKSENTKLLAFHELSDFQPISLSEMPQGYLESRNGRLLYMLKSFMIKQYDIVRRNIVQEWNSGNKALAARNAAVLSSYLMATNVGVQTARDMIYGREVRPEDIPSKAMWSLLGIYGGNQYLTERYLQGGTPTEFAVQTLTPATPIIDDLFKLGRDVADEDKEIELMRYTRSIPIVGPLLYAWFGGGTERYNERLD